MPEQSDILADADKAFIAAMQKLDDDAEASGKEWSDGADEIRKAFIKQVEDKLNNPLKIDPVKDENVI